jgi:ribosomal protein S27AE
MTWTNFHESADGTITLFDAGTCPNCGSTVAEANAVTGCDSADHYTKLGLREVFGPMPGEIEVTHDGGYACSRCNP